MKKQLPILFSLGMLVTVGCGGPQYETLLRKVDTQRLLGDADILWETKHPAQGISELLKAEWTAPILSIKPDRVLVDESGVYLEMNSYMMRASGIFLLPTSSGFQPKKGTDPSYHKLQERIYAYQIEG